MITLNADQTRAGEEILAAVAKRRRHLLTGHAGSGKTTLLRELLRGLRGVAVTATTHKACAVLQRGLNEAGLKHHEVVTIHSLLGLKPRVRGDRMEYLPDRKAQPVQAETVFVDEASMLSEGLMTQINRLLPGRAVIFVGDPAQLPPVGEADSPVFKTRSGSHLNTPERFTRENPLYAVSDTIRRAQETGPDWSWARPRNIPPHGVFVPKDPDAWMKKAFTSREFNQDPDQFRYICYTNKRVAEVNRKIREWRYGRVETPFVRGERAVMNAPLVKGKNVLLNNNEELTVTGIRFDREQDLDCWAIDLKRDSGEEISGHIPVDPMAFRSVMGMLAEQCNRGERSWGEYHAFKSGFLDVQAIYALTTHKSQGSTFRNSFVDLGEMKFWVRKDQTEGLKGTYVATTRQTHGLILV